LKFYVYAHKDLSGNIFYVGKGSKIRMTRLLKANNTSMVKSRSKAYYEKVKELDFNYTYEILAECCTNAEAEELEKIYFDKLNKIYTLTNKLRPSSTKEIDIELMNTLFYYDKSSPSGLRNKTEIRTGKDFRIIKKKVGDVVGTLNSVGYYIINIKSTLYLAHRVVYALHNNGINNRLVIDHIDRNKQNNSIENLRCVTQKENTKNSAIRSNNTSGIIGIMHDTKRNRFRAYVTNALGNQVTRSFSIKLHGFDKALELATNARAELLQSVL